MTVPLPIDGLLDRLVTTVQAQRVAVLVAPPGTGKTTRVPPALARSRPGRVVVLEPRRVAARAAASRVAAEWGCAVGEEVGFHVRGQRRWGPSTRVLFVTEGMFLNYVTQDPFLEGVSTVVLDEFHERSVQADLALALTRSIQTGLREDLCIVAMSATLEAGPVAAYLDAPILQADSPLHPLDVRFDPRPDSGRLEDRVAAAVAEVRAAGDVLVFLPGIGEIRRAAVRIGGRVDVLHGGLDAREQDRVLTGQPGGRVILATNVAESSVTVPGVRAVVDSGLARVLRRDRSSGIDRLEVLPIAKDSADQRSGRAAREAPGVVRRLWTARDHADRAAHQVPAIHRTDLAPTVLQLLVFGEPDPRTFAWFDRPTDAALDDAMKLLTMLGAVARGQITSVGQQLAAMPLHPRLGRFVLEAQARGQGAKAARLALWMSDGGRPDGDLVRVSAPSHPDARRLATSSGGTSVDLQRAALAGWPDRVAKERGDGAVMAGGIGLLGGRSPWFTALALHPSKRGPRGEWWVTLQAELDPEWLPRTTRREVVFDGSRVSAFDVGYAGELEITRHPAPLDRNEGAVVLAAALRDRIHEVLPQDPAFHELVGRLRFVAEHRPHPGLPAGDPASLGDLLERACRGVSTKAAVRKAPWRGLLLDGLEWSARKHLDREAPVTVALPSGGTASLRYGERGEPVLSERIQRLFGLASTPRVAGEPVRVELLAPNGRPQQITRDLENFWAVTYFEVRKDLRRRYPKHAWPDDPTVPVPRRPRRKR